MELRTIQCELKKWQLISKKEANEKERNKETKEKFWKEMMGQNRPKYFRGKGGAFKQK